MNGFNDTLRMNCTVRYLLNESFIDPISVDDRYPKCELYKKFMPTILYISRTFILIWLISGLFGNFVSFLIWTSKEQRRKNSSAIYLAALALTDFILILLLINYDLETSWCIRGISTINGICQIYQCLFIFTQFYSIVLVFGFTLERYLAVCFPFKRLKLCTTKRALIAVVILSLFVIGPMLFQIVLWNYENGECQMRMDIALDRRIQTLISVQEIVFSLVIPLATLVFNILVLCEMRRLLKSSNLLKITKHHSCSSNSNNTTTTTTTAMNTARNTMMNDNDYKNLIHKRFRLKSLFKPRKSTQSTTDQLYLNDNSNNSTRNSASRNDDSTGTPNFSPSRTSNFNVNNNNNANTNPPPLGDSLSKESSQFVSATLMLIILSFYLIACTVPAGIVYLVQFQLPHADECLNDEGVLNSLEWNSIFQQLSAKKIVDALCASHYACNFFIYFLTCTGFRKQALNMIFKCRFKQSRYSQSDFATETLILSRRTAPRTLRPISDNDMMMGMETNHKALLIYNNNSN
ncbi:unnamed protein product [Trichobilharzia szidati]|nr:unnamed protein product [Trichobilharzia szidati]